MFPLGDKQLRIGILGMTEGNGHPYSWSAMFNHYNKEEMETCGFPVIPRYLEKQPEHTFGIPGAKITCVCCTGFAGREEAEHIAFGREYLGFPVAFAQRHELDAGRTASYHVQSACRFLGKVDDACAYEGPTVIDAHDDTAPVVEVGHTQARTEGQELVGGRHGVLVVAFAVGGLLSVEARAVP